jgi:predicted house-cleaning noncanonical NTP pyrophosphatase (MazG superfamily)
MTDDYDKLVRDDIPEIVEANGERPVVHHVEGEEYTQRLLDKLDEEVGEYRSDRTVEELADVLEVVHALCGTYGVDWSELQQQREQKADRRGQFKDGIVLEHVER